LDLVPPVTAGIFPLQQRSLRRRLRDPDDSVSHDGPDREDGEVSLRPNPTIANMNMLLEILSEAGAPANMSQPIRAVTDQGPAPKRRNEDYQNADTGRAQYRFDFTE
jgi:hypothetical protein